MKVSYWKNMWKLSMEKREEVHNFYIRYKILSWACVRPWFLKQETLKSTFKIGESLIYTGASRDSTNVISQINRMRLFLQQQLDQWVYDNASSRSHLALLHSIPFSLTSKVTFGCDV